MFTLIPMEALFFKPTHRHSAFVSSTFLRPEQHKASGLSTWLPIVTKDKHVAMFSTTKEHSMSSTKFPLTYGKETERKRRRRGITVENTAISVVVVVVWAVWHQPKKRRNWEVCYGISWHSDLHNNKNNNTINNNIWYLHL